MSISKLDPKQILEGLKAPKPPRPRTTRFRTHDASTITATIETVTPILGGSSRLRKVDKFDVIRGPTIRGHLRFWWRALNAHRPEYRDPKQLYEAESAVWGRAGDEKGGRSKVDVQLRETRHAVVDNSMLEFRDPSFYALWPARSTRADRLNPGLRFDLAITSPHELEPDVRHAFLAWLLFGGYGSRTRRGVGSLKLITHCQEPFKVPQTRNEFTTLFGRDIFAEVRAATDTPTLAGASLVIGQPATSADCAWSTALGWLREFRQGTASGARVPDTGKGDMRRSSISNWPEPDKVRHFSPRPDGLPWAHDPGGRHNAIPAWPRAGFGLPIVGQFQDQTRHKNGKKTHRGHDDYYKWRDSRDPKFGAQSQEPEGYQIRWLLDEVIRERLASPLIIKPLQVGPNKFAPMALWLNRAFPQGGVVTLVRSDENGVAEVKGPGRASPRAPFDRLHAEGDKAHVPPLQAKTTLRAAFVDWLKDKKLTVIAP